MAPPKRKRRRIQESKNVGLAKEKTAESNVLPENSDGKSTTTFLSLNDDCCTAIFERLPLATLYVVSKTCTRFQRLAAAIFTRQNSSKVVTIKGMADDGELNMGPDEQYVKTFGKFIKNVTLDGCCTNTMVLEKLKAMYMENGQICSPIVALRFENDNSGLNESHCKTIADIAKGVEWMTLANVKIDGDLNEVMLHLMPNLKGLTLWKKMDEPSDDEKVNWMDKSYPKLEYFAWHLDREIPLAKYKRFLQANPNIETFSLLSKSQETIDQLIEQQIHVDELFFVVPSNVAAALNALQQLNKKLLVKRLHLKFADSVRNALKSQLNRLTALGPRIEGLYFEQTDIDKLLTKIISKFENLKMLQLNISKYVTDLGAIASITQLQEVFVYWSLNYINWSANLKALRTFASNTPHLQKIYLRNNARNFGTFEFSNHSKLRRNLANAKKLKIYVKTDETKATGPFPKRRDYGMVEAVRVETEIVKNPLINEFLTTVPLAQHFKDRFDNSDYDSISSDSFSGSDSDDKYRWKERKRDARDMARKYGRDWYKWF